MPESQEVVHTPFFNTLLVGQVRQLSTAPLHVAQFVLHSVHTEFTATVTSAGQLAKQPCWYKKLPGVQAVQVVRLTEQVEQGAVQA